MEGRYEEETQPTHRSFDGVVDVIRENKGEFLLLAGIAVMIVIAFRETRTLTWEESRYVPELILALMTVVLILTVLMKFFGDPIKSRFGISDVDPTLDVSLDDDLGEESDQLYEMRPVGVSIHLAWLFVYLLSLNFVGFWTTNIVFTIVYIMVNETSPLPRRFAYAVGWTVLIVGALWILLVELLVITAIWRFGFLP